MDQGLQQLFLSHLKLEEYKMAVELEINFIDPHKIIFMVQDMMQTIEHQLHIMNLDQWLDVQGFNLFENKYENCILRKYESTPLVPKLCVPDQNAQTVWLALCGKRPDSLASFVWSAERFLPGHITSYKQGRGKNQSVLKM